MFFRLFLQKNEIRLHVNASTIVCPKYTTKDENRISGCELQKQLDCH